MEKRLTDKTVALPVGEKGRIAGLWFSLLPRGEKVARRAG